MTTVWFVWSGILALLYSTTHRCWRRSEMRRRPLRPRASSFYSTSFTLSNRRLSGNRTPVDKVSTALHARNVVEVLSGFESTHIFGSSADVLGLTKHTELYEHDLALA